MATINHFEELDIWKMSRILCTETYNIITKTELKTDYKLKEQINSSSGSVMDYIAEGFERNENKEFNNFFQYQRLLVAKLNHNYTEF